MLEKFIFRLIFNPGLALTDFWNNPALTDKFSEILAA